MKKEILANSFVLVGIVAYNFLFWGEKLGLNILIFSVALLACLFTLYPEARQSRIAQITAIGTLLSAIMIVFNNSGYAKVIHFISLTTTVGFVQQYVLRFFWYGFVVLFMNFSKLPQRWFKALEIVPKYFTGFHKVKRFTKLAIFPAAVLFVFYWIYAFANPAFAKISADVFDKITHFLTQFTFSFSIERIAFLLVGFIFLSLAIYKNNWENLITLDLQKRFKLSRFVIKKQDQNLVKAKIQKGIPPKMMNFIRLKNEYRTALLLVWSLNALLFFVNLTDIRFVWRDFSDKTAFEMRQIVHEGTYLLIFAILLAMGIILFYFRKNLNFYPKNQLLKMAAYVWIIQNLVLAFSVGIRTYHYIAQFGLAYKRIGVYIFLLLTAIGLVTMLLKVRDKQTTYALIFKNSWIAYSILVTLTFVNGDVFITKYNLNNFEFKNVDIGFLLKDVSDKNLWVLAEADFDKMTEIDVYYKPSNLSSWSYETINIAKTYEVKKQQFLDEQKAYSWVSWNYADFLNEKRLTTDE
jgi:hypothetical protein